MTNLYLFLLSTAVYFLGFWFFHSREKDLKYNIKAAAVIALLSLPVNVNGYVFTVIGNAEGKYVYSLASFYQKAEQDAVTLVGISGYQKAEMSAWTIVGVSGYQQAGKNAGIMIGISGYQRAEMSAWTIVGVSGYQQAGIGDKTNKRVFGAFFPLKAP